eukprot:360750-Rhodomonas_salina.1
MAYAPAPQAYATAPVQSYGYGSYGSYYQVCTEREYRPTDGGACVGCSSVRPPQRGTAETVSSYALQYFRARECIALRCGTDPGVT